MKLVKRIMTNKILVALIAVIIQFFLIIYFAQTIISKYPFVYVILMIFSTILVIWIVNLDENPSYALAWTIVIMVLPPFGAVVYLLFGGRKTPKKLSEQISESFDGSVLFQDTSIMEDLDTRDQATKKQAQHILNNSGFPIYYNRRSEYLATGELKFERMLEEISKAKKFILLEYFIIKDGYMWRTLRDALKVKIDEGVIVRLIYDDWGCATFEDLQQQCDEVGIEAYRFNPIKPRLAIQMNNRSHRKACIVDGRVAIVGGLNIADEYINKIERFGHWKDTAVVFEGEVVHSFTLMFLQFYRYYAKKKENPEYFKYDFGDTYDEGFIQGFADAPTDNVDVSIESHINMISNAKHYVYIQTPYLIVGYEMIQALRIAALSGVDVRIIVPGIPDKWMVNQISKSNYEALIRAGVRIYEYSPGFVHSKTIVADDRVAMIGTTNMDFRSYYMHFESSVMFAYNQVVLDCRDDHLATFEISQEIFLEDILKTPYILRLIRGMVRIFSGLL